MEENKRLKCDLVQLRDALTQVKKSADQYNAQQQKSVTLLAEFTKSLNQLNTLTASNKTK